MESTGVPMGRVAQLGLKGLQQVVQNKEKGLPKQPVAELDVSFEGVRGDYNHYRQTRLKGDDAQALSLMTRDIIENLNEEGWPVKYGDLGENLTFEDVPYATFALGQLYRLGTVEFEISRIMEPCNNLGALEYVGLENRREFLKALEGRRGWFGRVLKEGKIKTGDVLYQIKS